MQLVLYAALGVFFNAFIRGGYIKEWFPNFRFSKIINAIAFGIAAYFASYNMLYSALMAVGMMIGQAPAIFDNEIDEYYKNRQYLDWSLIVLERALVWALPLLVVSMPFHHDHALWWLLLAPVMPLAYSVMFCEWLHTRVNRWALGEAIFGLAIWVLLVI